MFGMSTEFLITGVIILAIAIFLLKGFDRIAGRGPKQVSDAIKKAMKENQ